jgi:hypothetical protein
LQSVYCILPFQNKKKEDISDFPRQFMSSLTKDHRNNKNKQLLGLELENYCFPMLSMKKKRLKRILSKSIKV